MQSLYNYFENNEPVFNHSIERELRDIDRLGNDNNNNKKNKV